MSTSTDTTTTEWGTITSLQAARDLLAQPYRWGKYTFIKKKRTRKGEHVDCFCAVGALREVRPLGWMDLEIQLERTLRDHGLFASVPDFNDNHCKKKADILWLFDETIARLEAQAA